MKASTLKGALRLFWTWNCGEAFKGKDIKSLKSRRLNGAFWRYFERFFWELEVLRKFWKLGWNQWRLIVHSDANKVLFVPDPPPPTHPPKHTLTLHSHVYYLFRIWKWFYLLDFQFKSLLERIKEYATLRACVS